MPRQAAHPDVAETAFPNVPLASQATRLADRGLFLKKFLVKGRQISSAVPSSRALVAGMLRPVDFGRPATIIELGAGIGPVTEVILPRLRPFHRFVAVENDPDFCDVLRRRFPRLDLLEGDAGKIAGPLAARGIHKVDYVLSGLPTPNLPRTALAGLWRWLRHALGADGLFVQITVAPLVYRAFYDRLFHQVDYRMVWRNMPPGGVYVCSRPRRARGNGTAR